MQNLTNNPAAAFNLNPILDDLGKRVGEAKTNFENVVANTNPDDPDSFLTAQYAVMNYSNILELKSTIIKTVRDLISKILGASK